MKVYEWLELTPPTLRLGDTLTPSVLCEQALGCEDGGGRVLQGKPRAHQLSPECLQQARFVSSFVALKIVTLC